MRLNLVVSVSVGIAVVAMLLLVASPVVTAAAMDRPAGAHDSCPYQEGEAIPLHLSHCFLTNTNTVAKQAVPAPRLIPDKYVCVLWSPKTMAAESSSGRERPFQWDIAPPLSLSSPYIVYHCRNLLNSEEPPL